MRKSASELNVGDTVLAGIPERRAVVTGFSERDPGRSPVKGGIVLHLSGAHDMTMFESDRVAVVGGEP